MKYSRKKWLPAAIGIVLLVIVIIGFVLFKTAHPFPVKFVRAREMAVSEPVTYLAEIPRWDTLPIYGQYNTIEWNESTYNSHSAELPANRIGEFLGETTANGWDDYAAFDGENGERQIGAKLYAVTKLSTECVIAVQYEGTDTWYAFSNSDYRPETLGQFMEDLNMKEEVVFGTVHYSFFNSFNDYISIQFENVDNQLVRDMLLSDGAAQEVYNELELFKQPKRIMGISVDIPLLGIENISLSVQEDGYIMTNILATGKLFYIGEEKTQSFVDFVLNECDGYETIYLYKEEPVPESFLEGFPEFFSNGGSSGAASPSVAPAE